MVHLIALRSAFILFTFISLTGYSQPTDPRQETERQRTTTTSMPLIILDAHEDVLIRVTDRGDDLADPHTGGQADIPKWKAGGVNAVWFSVWIDSRKYSGQAAVDRAMEMIQAFHGQMRKHPTIFQPCDTAADCRAAVAAGKIAALLGIEGGIAINNDLSMIEKYRNLSVRYMTLTWRGNLDWAGSSQTKGPQKGLSEFGREVVREMNRVGMIVDLSHVSDKTFFDALEVTKKPVILSHSNARALAPHPRNISDEMLVALKKNGGVIGINFNRGFLARGTGTKALALPSVETILDQIDHVVKVAGVDHVGFGSDWDGGVKPARGVETASGMRRIIEGLHERGYSAVEIRKIAGENFLRVLEANEGAE